MLDQSAQIRSGRRRGQLNREVRARGNAIATSYLSRRAAAKHMKPMSEEDEQAAIAAFIRKRGVLRLVCRPNGKLLKRRVRE